MENAFIGEIKMFAGNYPPRYWAFCDGQLLPIQQNEALFSIIGCTFGGDCRTTFALPDLRGRVAIHPGQGQGLSDYRLGQRGGQEQVLLNVAQLPSHHHPTNEKTIHVARGNDVQALSQGQGGSTGNAGDSQPVNNMPPYLCINHIICLRGSWPQRD